MIIAAFITKVFKLVEVSEDGTAEWPGFLVIDQPAGEFMYVTDSGALVLAGAAREVDGNTEIELNGKQIMFGRTSEGHSETKLNGKAYRLVAQLPELNPIELIGWVAGLVAMTNERARAAGLPAGQITPGDVRPFPTGRPRT